MAPIWMIAVKAVTPLSSIGQAEHLLGDGEVRRCWRRAGTR